MSPSPESIETGTLQASANFPGTELLLLDDDREVVDRGVNRLPSRAVAAGIYTVRAILGGNHVDKIAVVRPGQHTSVRIEAPAMGSAMPLAHTGKTHEYHQAAAEKFSRTDKQRLDHFTGPASELFLMVREWNRTKATRRGARPDRMGKNVRICDEQGETRFSFADVPQHPWGEDNCTARTFVLPPGFTRLSATVGAFDYEMPLYTAEGWQLQCYVLATGDAGDVMAGDLTQASTTMRRIDRGFSPGDFDGQAIEGARSALESSSGGVPDEVLHEFLWEKFENPMLGLLAAHAMLRRGTMDRALLKTVATNLAGLIGPIPDVAALLLEVDPQAAVPPITTPPMLRASWSMLIDHSADRPALIPASSFAARIARRVVGAGAWLIWQRPEEDTEGLESLAPSNRTTVPKADKRLAARWLGLPASLLDES